MLNPLFAGMRLSHMTFSSHLYTILMSANMNNCYCWTWDPWNRQLRFFRSGLSLSKSLLIKKTIHIKTLFTAIIFAELTCQHKSTLCSFSPGNSRERDLSLSDYFGKSTISKKNTKRIITLLLVFGMQRGQDYRFFLLACVGF